MTLLPTDHTFTANTVLLEKFRIAARDQGLRASEDDFQAAREALIEAAKAVKGKGRGGSTARSTGTSRPAFALEAEAVTPDMLADKRPAKTLKKIAPTSTAFGEPQVLSYR